MEEHGTSDSRGSGIMIFVEANRRKLLILFIMMGIFGAWLNAQGGWVKDFSYHRTVVLPFLFRNFTTTGLNWYFAGLADGLTGLFGNLIGIYGFKYLSGIQELNVYRRKLFVIPLIVYFVGDIVAFGNFYNYWIGVTGITLYGMYWNILQYFVLLPAFILTDLLLLMYKIR